GTEPWHWYSAAQYPYAAAGENLAKGFRTSKALATAWMHSDSHRENILGADYKDVGIAVVNGVLAGEETTLVVAHFGLTKDDATALSQPETIQLSTTTSNNLTALSSPAHISALTSPMSILSLLLLLTVSVIAAL